MPPSWTASLLSNSTFRNFAARNPYGNPYHMDDRTPAVGSLRGLPSRIGMRGVDHGTLGQGQTGD